MPQATNTILMIRPIAFRMNEQTAVNNYYQRVIDNILPSTVQAKALAEFDTFVTKLKQIGVNIIVIDDTLEPSTPDSIFPNNWISFHQNGNIGTYPMFAVNRRLERREDVFDVLEQNGFQINDIIDYTVAEAENLFLEGTGSLVLDRVYRKAYCALSPRADEDLLYEFCEDFEYTPVEFKAFQTVNNQREAIYHTNVMMCIAPKFAVVCLDCIDDKKERKNLISHLKQDDKEIITITEAQVNNFAGNMLSLYGKDKKEYIIMSESAFKCLTAQQIAAIEKYATILYSNVDTIEACGGGSVRCMMAEVFLPKAK